MIVKPAQETPLTMLLLAKLMDEAGLPKGVLSVLPTSSPGAVTEALIDDGRLRKLTFTGSTGVGRKLAEQCAPTLKRVSMELGGAAPLIVFADADLAESAANLEPLLLPVLIGSADLTVANIPRSASSLGSGRVVRLARAQIEAMTGRVVEQPLNGMRALTRETFADATPLASGWGVEAAMLVDVLRAGRRGVEVPVELTHRRTGNDIKGRVHRAMQLRDVSTALLARRFLS